LLREARPACGGPRISKGWEGRRAWVHPFTRWRLAATRTSSRLVTRDQARRREHARTCRRRIDHVPRLTHGVEAVLLRAREAHPVALVRSDRAHLPVYRGAPSWRRLCSWFLDFDLLLTPSQGATPPRIGTSPPRPRSPTERSCAPRSSIFVSSPLTRLHRDGAGRRARAATVDTPPRDSR
jgi:hypothetical protein